MMAEGGFRKLRGRGAMRVRHRTQRRVADGCVVQVQHGGFAQVARVVGAQSHHEVVRMLAVDNRMAVRGLTGLEQLRVAFAGDGGGLRLSMVSNNRLPPANECPAEPMTQLVEYSCVSAAWRPLLCIDDKRLAHQHERPRAVWTHQHGGDRDSGFRLVPEAVRMRYTSGDSID